MMKELMARHLCGVELGWEEGEMDVLLWEEERKSNTSLRLD
jgi:hypothetical protein